jgi:hypothetical protein
MDAVAALYLKRDRERQLWLVQALRPSVCFRPSQLVPLRANCRPPGTNRHIQKRPRRFSPYRLAPRALRSVPVSSSANLAGERTMDLTSLLERPEAAAISRSCASTIPRAGSSPSKPANTRADTLRFELRVPSTYTTSNMTKLVEARLFIAMTATPLSPGPGRRTGPPRPAR